MAAKLIPGQARPEIRPPFVAASALETRPARLHFEKWSAVVQLGPAFVHKRLRLKTIHRSPEREDVEIVEQRKISEANQFAAKINHVAECVLTGRRARRPGEEGLAGPAAHGNYLQVGPGQSTD